MLNKEQLSQLRKEISLGSLFTNDYINSFNIEKHSCQDFFDAFADYIGELMIEDNHDDNEYWDIIDQYDTDDNLWDWYNCYEDEPFKYEDDWQDFKPEYGKEYADGGIYDNSGTYINSKEDCEENE